TPRRCHELLFCFFGLGRSISSRPVRLYREEGATIGAENPGGAAEAWSAGRLENEVGRGGGMAALEPRPDGKYVCTVRQGAAQDTRSDGWPDRDTRKKERTDERTS